jgi:hypothetical protein
MTDHLTTLVPLAVWDPGVVQKLLLSVLGLVIIIAAIRLGGRANQAQYSETARVGFNTVIAIVIGGIGAGAIAFAVFGKQVLQALGVNLG